MLIIDITKEHLKFLMIKNIGEYHDLYVKSDTLLLSNVFENSRDKCFEIYELDPDHFISTWISLESLFKNTEIRLKLILIWYVINGRKRNQRRNVPRHT